jgi:hypothetical protein
MFGLLLDLFLCLLCTLLGFCEEVCAVHRRFAPCYAVRSATSHEILGCDTRLREIWRCGRLKVKIPVRKQKNG